MKQLEKKYFSMGGEQQGLLNADDAAFAIGTNQWVNMQDMRIGSTDKGETAQVEFNGGTRKISPSYVKTLDYVNIGSVPDYPKRRIINFLKGNFGFGLDSRIEVYFADTDVTLTALLDRQVSGGLNFNTDYPIHSARVVGDILYWVEGDNNEPRKLNIEAALKLNNPTYNTEVIPYTTPIEPGVITLIRNPPSFKLGALAQTDSLFVQNFLTNFAGQFAWRFIFRDGEVSKLSDKSKLINYSIDTKNRVKLTARGHIDQDVQQVDYCVRYGNNPQFYVIKSWNKSIPSEAAEIEAHNNGTSTLTYYFYNKNMGVSLDISYSASQFDSVPFYSETLEVGIGRLFLGNNTASYNSPITSATAVLGYSSTTSPIQGKIFKNLSQYRVGLQFLDQAKRVLGNVITNDNLLIKIPDRTYDYLPYYNAISVLFPTGAQPNEIPEDAKYCVVMCTKNTRTRNFLTSVTPTLYFVTKDIDGNYVYSSSFTGDVIAIAVSTDYIVLDKLGYVYDPASNDLCRLYFSNGNIYELKVNQQVGNYIFIDPQYITIPSDPVVFEIYTPYSQIGDEIFYSISQSLEILNPGTPSRSFPASSFVISGDTYLQINAFYTATLYLIDYMNQSRAYWKEWLGDWGDIGIKLISKRIKKINSVQFSNTLIEGTSTNGMSTFEALDEKILPVSMGALRKLQQTSKVQQQGNIMLAIGEEETASLYLGEVQLVGSDTNSTLAYAPNVIGTVNILKGNFGTVNPESVVEYRGQVYWLDAHNGRVIQYSVNGLFPISNYKMTRFWKLWCKKFLETSAATISGFGCRPFVFMAVDPTHDELVISIPKLSDTPPKGYLPDYPETTYPFDPLDYQGKTMVYDIKNSRWLGCYSYYAETLVSVSNQLYSSSNGILYEHNQYETPAKYYGVQYTPKIMFVANQEPNKPKVFATVSVQSNLVPKLMYFYNIEPYQQCSDLVDFQFRNIEDAWTCAIMRNKLTPTSEGYNTDGLLTNEPMRSVAMFVELSFDAVAPLKLRFVNIGYSLSYGNTTV